MSPAADFRVTCRGKAVSLAAVSHYEQPEVVPHDGQAWQLPARCICTPHWKQ